MLVRAWSATVTVTVALTATLAAQQNGRAEPDPSRRTAAPSSVAGGGPLVFVENTGQLPPEVRFYAQSRGAAMYFAPRAAVFTFVKHEARSGPHPTPDRAPAPGLALAMRFVGANRHPAVGGRRPGPARWNHLVGQDRTKWRTNLPTWEEVTYHDLWPGVDAVFRGRDGELKYDFVLQPGAQPASIALRFEGATGLRLDPAGNLVIETALGPLEDAAPVSYQEIDGTRVPVESRYVLRGAGAARRVTFQVGTYDRSRPLIIDPALRWR
jgi:hypothetical protein